MVRARKEKLTPPCRMASAIPLITAAETQLSRETLRGQRRSDCKGLNRTKKGLAEEPTNIDGEGTLDGQMSLKLGMRFIIYIKLLRTPHARNAHQPISACATTTIDKTTYSSRTD